MRAVGLRLLCLGRWALAFLLLPVLVHAESPLQPPTLLLLFDGLTVDDLEDPHLPSLHALIQKGQVGLMNCAVAGPQNDTSALLTLALGALSPSEPTDRLIYTLEEPVEGATAGIVYQRRTGLSAPPASDASPQTSRLVHLGIASLTRRGLNGQTLGAVLERAGKANAFVYGGMRSGQDRDGALLVLGAEGQGPACLLTDDPEALVDWVVGQKTSGVLQIGGATRAEGLQRLERCLARFLRTTPLDRYHLMLISPRPPAAPGAKWDRLPLVLLVGADVKSGLLTSATTRTPGLIANIDVAPTLLTWWNVPVPATMTGHSIRGLPAVYALAELKRMDRMVTVNARGLVPVFLLISLVCLISVGGGLLALRTNPSLVRLFAFGLLAAMNMPLALLLVVLLAPTDVVTLTAETLTLMMALALLETLLPRILSVRFRTTLAPLLLSVLAFSSWTCLALLVDSFCGQTLVKFSLLSSYQLQGIRYYGLGNEYMGVLTGCALLAVFLARMRPGPAGGLFLLLLFVIGFPRLGADAGGVIGAMAGFGTGWMLLRGKAIGWRAVVLWTLLGIVVAFVIGFTERFLPGGSTSHIGGSLQAAHQRGYGYLGEIVWRKILMNGRIFVHPAMLTALGCIGTILLLARGAFRRPVEDLYAKYPDWARGLPAAGYGALITFLFNDSGIVAAAFLLGAFLVSGLYFLFTAPSSLPASA